MGDVAILEGGCLKFKVGKPLDRVRQSARAHVKFHQSLVAATLLPSIHIGKQFAANTLAQAAKEVGALFAINSDVHSASQLQDIRYGVFQARRRWSESASVINAWTCAKLGRWLGKPMKR